MQRFGLFFAEHLAVGHEAGRQRDVDVGGAEVGRGLVGVDLFARGGSEVHGLDVAPVEEIVGDGPADGAVVCFVLAHPGAEVAEVFLFML